MELKQLRDEIDRIDGSMASLLAERMTVVDEIARCKRENGLPVYDPRREREKLTAIAESAGADMAPATDALFSLVFDLSRSRQNRAVAGPSPIKERIKTALESTERLFPTRPLTACQGVEGAYAQMAAQRLFPAGALLYFSSFESVFAAVEQGLCRYGVLPLENSTAGSVNRVYDLMMAHDFSIVRSCRVKVDHCLLANKGAKLEDIRVVASHEQALSQCRAFLETLTDVEILPCENTAAAAKQVRDSGRRDMAALSSRSCAQLYRLETLADSVQDQGSNYTRFICISKKLEIYPGADRTSLMMVLPNRRGALYRALSRFNALGINIIKLESRPLANSDFEFMFYFDLDCSVYSEEFLRLFDDLEGVATRLEYLGSYTEVV